MAQERQSTPQGPLVILAGLKLKEGADIADVERLFKEQLVPGLDGLDGLKLRILKRMGMERLNEATDPNAYDYIMMADIEKLQVFMQLRNNPEAGLDTIEKVYSHPQALAQCRSFLKHLNCELIPTYNTAASVRMVKEHGRPDSAAIASARAAEIYDMKVLAREIEDNPNNFTRFFILAQEDSSPSGNDKTSIVFSAKDRPGALYQALGEFASRNINLTKLESRPTRQKPWEYNFYLDFVGHRQDEAARETLASLEKASIFVKVLGSYPKAR